MAEEKSKILDLDGFIPEDKEVIIAKKKYIVRGDASVRMTLALMKNAETWQKRPQSQEAIDALFESIQAFFKTKIEREVLDGLGIKALPRLFAFLYDKKLPDVDEKNEKSQPDQQ